MNKTQKILRYLDEGNTLTQLEALKMFRCLRLAVIIHNLRKRGNDIQNVATDTKYAIYKKVG